MVRPYYWAETIIGLYFGSKVNSIALLPYEKEPQVGDLQLFLAERQGFEPWVPVRVQRFSRPSRSTTPASFLGVSGAKLRNVFCSARAYTFFLFLFSEMGAARVRANVVCFIKENAMGIPTTGVKRRSNFGWRTLSKRHRVVFRLFGRESAEGKGEKETGSGAGIGGVDADGAVEAFGYHSADVEPQTRT